MSIGCLSNLIRIPYMLSLVEAHIDDMIKWLDIGKIEESEK